MEKKRKRVFVTERSRTGKDDSDRNYGETIAEAPGVRRQP
jgi:hypothetical protein